MQIVGNVDFQWLKDLLVLGAATVVNNCSSKVLI